MRVGFHTFGCKLNQYETEALASPLRNQGFSIAGAREEADLYIVNTCTVTSRADHKARALIRALAREHPAALLVVTGCAAQLEAESLGALAPNILVVPQSEKAVLLDLPRFLREARAGQQAGTGSEGRGGSNPFAFTVVQPTFHTRAFLKIQDGCDSCCAYCRVPLARGSSASLPLAEVLRRAMDLESAGSREIVITGVNISAWRSDGLELEGLLRALLEQTTRPRLRLSSLEPEALSEGLARVLGEPRICPHFHLPVQSGSDEVLGRMKRRYRADRVREGAALLRTVKTEPFIAADVIVGFPGETDEDFLATRRLVEDLQLAALHVFPFSPGPARQPSPSGRACPNGFATSGRESSGNLSRRLSSAYAESWVGRDVAVLVERRTGTIAEGTSENYLKVRISGVPADKESRGTVIRARLTAAARVCRANFQAFEA